MQSQMQCRSCDAVIPVGSRFCAGCGADMSKPPVQSTTAMPVRAPAKKSPLTFFDVPLWAVALIVCAVIFYGVVLTALIKRAQQSPTNSDDATIPIRYCTRCMGKGRIKNPFDGVTTLCPNCGGMGMFRLDGKD